MYVHATTGMYTAISELLTMYRTCTCMLLHSVLFNADFKLNLFDDPSGNDDTSTRYSISIIQYNACSNNNYYAHDMVLLLNLNQNS